MEGLALIDLVMADLVMDLIVLDLVLIVLDMVGHITEVLVMVVLDMPETLFSTVMVFIIGLILMELIEGMEVVL